MTVNVTSVQACVRAYHSVEQQTECDSCTGVYSSLATLVSHRFLVPWPLSTKVYYECHCWKAMLSSIVMQFDAAQLDNEDSYDNENLDNSGICDTMLDDFDSSVLTLAPGENQVPLTGR